jgi:hypothetical protein
VYGHSWFVDPERKFTLIALTNTALEGLAGRFPIELRDAIYRALQADRWFVDAFPAKIPLDISTEMTYRPIVLAASWP